MQKNIRKNGISLMVLTITIVALVILASAITIQASNSLSSANEAVFSETIILVEDQTKIYYVENDKFPVMGGTNKMNIDQLLSYSELSDENKLILKQELIKNGDYNSIDDVGEYYIIDLSKLDLENSKIGNVGSGKNDVFFVSYPTMNVYYLKGKDIDGKMFFSITSEFERTANITAKKDTSVTTYRKVAGIEVKADSKIWSNKLGLTINANLDVSEELFMKISGVSSEKKITTVVGENNFFINNLMDAKSFVDITNEEILAFNNYNEKDIRSIEIVKKSNGFAICGVKIDYSKYDYVSPKLLSDIIVKSSENDSMNTCIVEISDGNGSGIKMVKYEYLTVFDESSNIIPYFENTEDFENVYLKSNGKEIKLSSNGKGQIRIPKNIESIQVYIEDNVGNWTKTIQKVSNLHLS